MIRIKEKKFLTQTIIAHKGIYDNKYIAENTLSAFELAIQKKYIIELDIHILKDNTIVVFHDNTLKRACGIDLKLKDCTYEEIKDKKVFGTNDTIPKLQEVLQLVGGKVGLLIELKYDTGIGRLEKEVSKQLKRYSGKVALQSFNPMSVIWFKIHKTQYPIGQLVPNILHKEGKKLEVIVSLSKMMTLDFLDCSLKLLENPKLQEARKEILLLGWTATSKAEYDKYILYADNLICEKFI